MGSKRAGRKFPQLLINDSSKIRRYSLSKQEITVGSDASNDIVITDATVSRRHAVIRREHAQWRLTDLKSTNGTFLNDQPISSVILRDGDRIRFGLYRPASFSLIHTEADQTTSRATHKSKSFFNRTLVEILIVLIIVGFAATEYLMNNNMAFQRLVSIIPASRASRSSSRSTSAVLGKSNVSANHESSSPSLPTPAWLSRLNHYRAIRHLSLLTQDARLDAGLHQRVKGIFAKWSPAIHLGEHPGIAMHAGFRPIDSAYFGPSVAFFENLAVHLGKISPPPSWAIDSWINVPFHRAAMLDPYARYAAYSGDCRNGLCILMLHMALYDRGAEWKTPVEFPPDGTNTPFTTLEGETPDPLTACPGYEPPAGLPITLELGSNSSPHLVAYSLTRNGEAVESCAFDNTTYTNPKPTDEKDARETLKAFGMIVLIPRTPLAPGATYEVSITTGSQTYRWAFGTAPVSASSSVYVLASKSDSESVKDRKAAWNGCLNDWTDYYIRESGGCGSCEGARDMAAKKCSGLLTAAERQCEAKTENALIGATIPGNPFACEN